jgi:hypothetical protein
MSADKSREAQKQKRRAEQKNREIERQLTKDKRDARRELKLLLLGIDYLLLCLQPLHALMCWR